MPEPKREPIPGALDDKELDGVQGGTAIPVTGPAIKPKAPGSIAQGEINSNSTDDNLPDSGGGVIV